MLESCKSSIRDHSKQSANFEGASFDRVAKSGDHDTLGLEFAKHQLYDLVKGKGQPFTIDTLIKSASTAIAVAEPLLFNIFGKEQILSERPYEVYLIDGFWYIGNYTKRLERRRLRNYTKC